MEELWKLVQNKERIIESQRDEIERLKAAVFHLKQENKELKEKVTSLTENDSVSGAKTGDDLLRNKSRSRSVGGSPLESPRSSKLVHQTSTHGNRAQRQRSFRSNEEDVKRSRSHSVSYELSEDLKEKQLEMLERKYGGSLRSRRAAKTIQQAFRQHCMNRNFEKLRHSAGERRLSKRLSELGRSNTVWTDRISDNVHTMGALLVQNNIEGHNNSDSYQNKGGESRLRPQMSLDQNMKIDSSLRTKLSKFERKKLERCKEVDLSDIPENQNFNKTVDEANNNRNSYPEMNQSSATDSSQRGPAENAVDLPSLNFETLLDSRETEILVDSFNSDSINSDSQNEITNHTYTHKPSASSLFSNASTDTLESNKSASYENFRTNYSDSGSCGSQGDLQIKGETDSSSLENIRTPEQKQMADQTLRFYMNQEVKLRNKQIAEVFSKKPPQVPIRAPEASPVWKRKSAMNGSIQVKPVEKRMSNISETSEGSFDGNCSSSPSSENVNGENVSLNSESSLHYQRRSRLSVTPDHHHSVPKSADKVRKRTYRIGMNLFNKKPDKGIEFLCECGFVEENPHAVAKFLISRKGLSKQMIGEYLGNLQNEFNMAVLEYFSQEIDLAGLQIDMALRKFQSFFRMPGEAQKIERLMEAFASRFCLCNPDQIKSFKNPDTIFLLAFAIIMLNTDLHNNSIKPERRMKPEDFIKNLRDLDDGYDIDRDILLGIYDRIKLTEFRAGVDHVTQVMKVEQTIVGKKPQLALPHRRLVCYCRLYEVHDPNKKEKIGLHQREVFLFNDCLLVTKILSKKKSGITYSFKQSFTLAGMHVYLYETSHYQFGVRLTNGLDGKTLITFNARNDHDRQKFVGDLKEAIAECNGMEQLRIEDELNKQSANHNSLERYANDDTRVLMYELSKPSDPALNRLSAPECGGLKQLHLSNSLTDLCEVQGMRRGSSGGSLDSGVASGSSQGVNSSGESLGTQTSQNLLVIKGPSSSSLLSSGKKGRSKGSLSQQYEAPHGTEV
ncbi:IQ motif and SEC7 domain-containing protein [Mytilus galloprovincialis]|nr:IQ motif and SEC7 domain-containing protein [Mytilus galloprovincialis]